MSPSLGKMGLRAQTSSDLQYLSLTSHTESGLFSASIKNRSKVGRLKRFSINSVPSRWLWREWWAPKFLLVCLPLSCKVTRLRMFLAWTPDYLASIYSRPFKDPSLHRPPPPSTSPNMWWKTLERVAWLCLLYVCFLLSSHPHLWGEGWVFMCLEFAPSESLYVQMRRPGDSTRINCTVVISSFHQNMSELKV